MHRNAPRRSSHPPDGQCLRLSRIERIFESKEISLFFSPSAVRAVTSLLSCLWIFHFCTCTYWYIGSSEGFGSTSFTPDYNKTLNPNSLNYLTSAEFVLSMVGDRATDASLPECPR